MSADQPQFVTLSLPFAPRFQAHVLEHNADRVLASLTQASLGKKVPRLPRKKAAADVRYTKEASLATAICNTILGTQRMFPHEVSDTPKPMTDKHLEIMHRLRVCPRSALPSVAQEFARSSMRRGTHIFQADPTEHLPDSDGVQS